MSSLPPTPVLADTGLITKRLAGLDDLLDSFRDDAAQLAAQLHSGSLGIDAWELAMRAKMKDLHVGALVMSRGGDWKSVSFSDWGRLGGHIRVQYRYLHRYAQAVQENAMGALQGGQFYSEKYLAWRSALYGGNARASFYRGLAGGLLDQVPGDGKTACLTGCKCILVFEEGNQPGQLFVYWTLQPAEHCEDCELLSVTWNPLELFLPVGMAVEWAEVLPEMEAVYV